MGGGRRLGLRVLAAAALALAGAAFGVVGASCALGGAALALAGATSALAAEARADVEVERLGDDRVRLRARGEPREAVLDALAREAGVDLARGSGRPAPYAVSAELADATLEEAFARVLEGVPYHLHYEAGPPDGAVTLRRVTIGLLPAAGSAEEADESAAGAARARRPPDPPPDVDAPADEDERRERAAALRDARSEAERAEAASLTRPSEDLPALLDHLADPSAQVRAAAAASLAEVEFGEDAFRAADGLVAALDDPDPAVVAAAVGALEDVYDVLPHPRIRAAVARLGRPSDPDVRAAVESFREWTEDAE